MAGLGKTLIYLGIVIVIAGVLVSFSDRLPWLGHLPGDIHIQRERFSFHFPLTTCIVVSIVISLVAYLLKR
jgi:thiosulfate reductase cytochrome b subunit